MKKLYLAYGSNMDEEQMAERCPEAKLVGASVVEEYCLLFKGSARGVYATIEQKAGGKLPVLVWEISESDEKSLDEYEDYPVLYYKEDIPVLLKGKTENTMAYIMAKDQTFGVPSEEYYDVLRHAYQKFEFPMDILTEAYEVSKAQMA